MKQCPYCEGEGGFYRREGYTCGPYAGEYGDHCYPAQLVVQDVLTLHGSQFKDAALIVASPPCQAYSYRAMFDLGHTGESFAALCGKGLSDCEMARHIAAVYKPQICMHA